MTVARCVARRRLVLGVERGDVDERGRFSARIVLAGALTHGEIPGGAASARAESNGGSFSATSACDERHSRPVGLSQRRGVCAVERSDSDERGRIRARVVLAGALRHGEIRVIPLRYNCGIYRVAVSLPCQRTSVAIVLALIVSTRPRSRASFLSGAISGRPKSQRRPSRLVAVFRLVIRRVCLRPCWLLAAYRSRFCFLFFVFACFAFCSLLFAFSVLVSGSPLCLLRSRTSGAQRPSFSRRFVLGP